MKHEYPRYGPRTSELEGTLSASDSALLRRFLQYCAISAGPNRVSKYRRYLLHLRDILEKPLSDITRDDAIMFWGLVRQSPYEEHTRIAIRKCVKRFLRGITGIWK